MSDVAHRFDYHPPRTPQRVLAHEDVRAHCRELATVLDQTLPPGREKALALTKVEEAMFWANAAVAREPQPE